MGQAAAKPAMSHLKVVLVGAHGCGKGGLCIRIDHGGTDVLEDMLDYITPSRYDGRRRAAPYLECSAKTGEGVDEVLAAAAAVRYPALPAGIDPRRYEYV